MLHCVLLQTLLRVLLQALLRVIPLHFDTLLWALRYGDVDAQHCVRQLVFAEYAGSPLQFSSEYAELDENTLLNNAFGISSVRARDTALVSSEPKSFWWYHQVVNSAQECGSLVDQHLLRSLTIELRDFLLVVILSHDDLNSPRPPWGKLNLWELCVGSYRTHSPLAPRASSLLLEANSISKSPRGRRSPRSFPQPLRP